MPRVRVIPPRVSASLLRESKTKVKVAAYCRVSTDHTDQETSFEGQQTHFTNLINANSDWELVEIYADEESGTGTAKRENFLRMIEDCEKGKINLVLTKSISRFARNTLDCLQYIRKLKALNIPIVFTKEGINTMDAGGEVLITILASIAQQESASISQNVQIGIRYHFQEGRNCSGLHNLLGYSRARDGSLEVVPEEACIIRRIYRDYLDGYSVKHIVERLKEERVRATKTTVNGIRVARHWNDGGIEYILENEKFSGDLLLQKFYTVDFLSKKEVRNMGQIPQYYCENNHDPIVPKTIFQQVQAERFRRKGMRYDHTYGLSGKVICGDCGSKYRRIKAKHTYWRCECRSNKKKHPDLLGCNNPGIKEEDLHHAMINAFNRLPEMKDELVRKQERLIWGGLHKADEMLRRIELEMESGNEDDELRQQWAEVSARRADYAEKDMQIRNLLDKINAIEGRDEGERDSRMYGACADPEEFFKITRSRYPLGPVTEFSEDDAMRFVEKVIVGKDRFRIVFKAGIEMEEMMGTANRPLPADR